MAGPNPELFSAVKGGVLSYSKSLARALAPAVRVNVLCPGWIETAFGEQADEDFRREVARVDAARGAGARPRTSPRRRCTWPRRRRPSSPGRPSMSTVAL